MTATMTVVTDLNEGDKLDLRDDPYATMLNPVTAALAPDDAIEDHENDMILLEHELAEVEDIVLEVGEYEPGQPYKTVVVHTSLVSFGCPLDHRVKRITEEG